MIKKIVLLTTLSTGFWLYNRLVDNVHVSDFYLNKWPKVSSHTVDPEVKNKALTILEQPFTYLGKGRQFFVFESQDKQWVLKFIKCQRINEWYEQIPVLSHLSYFRKERLEDKARRVHDLFQSLQLSSGPLQDLTGVLIAHIEQKPEFQRRVTVIDALGISHTVPIDEVPFVLQRKAQNIFPVLKESNDKKERLEQLYTLFYTLADRGVVDIDDGAVLRDNIGFLQDRAVYIDIGTFRVDSHAKDRLKRDLERLSPVEMWIQNVGNDDQN